MASRAAVRVTIPLLVVFVIAFTASRAAGRHGELPNRIPEPAPYNVDEAQFFPPPFESEWTGVDDPGTCDGCHDRILTSGTGP